MRGKVSSNSTETYFSEDHPRVCGEKLHSTTSCAAVRGSPPRVRGKVGVYVQGLGEKGITPACAGKSLGRSKRTPPFWDHPRVCGEKFRPAIISAGRPGSPPRVRGKVQSEWSEPAYIRITPACAGKRKMMLFQIFLQWDHPRVCGEKRKGRYS